MRFDFVVDNEYVLELLSVVKYIDENPGKYFQKPEVTIQNLRKLLEAARTENAELKAKLEKYND